MNGPRTGLTANGGFRKTANSEQYAFKVINIGGMCQSHLYVPNFLLPAGGALTITGFGMQMSSGQHIYQTYEVWCRLSMFELYKA